MQSTFAFSEGVFFCLLAVYASTSANFPIMIDFSVIMDKKRNGRRICELREAEVEGRESV